MEDRSFKNSFFGIVKKYRVLFIITAFLLVVACVAGVLLAKYISENRQQAAMISAGFHISSNLLETTTVNNIGNVSPIIIEVYNFEKENNEQISAVAIKYTVTVTNGTLVSVLDNGAIVPLEDGKYSFPASAKRTHQLTVNPSGSGDVTVSVAAVLPFTKTLSGTFNFNDPQYKIEKDLHNPDGDLYVLTVYSNGYNGDITFVLPSSVIADRTVPDQQTWLPGNSYVFSVSDHSAYTLRFFGNISLTSLTTVGSPYTITIPLNS